MKYEWKKHEKALYLPKAVPAPVTVPEHAFFMIRGEGNPNGEAFLEAIGVLYALSYAVKMLPKKGDAPEGYYEYAVFPLEGYGTRRNRCCRERPSTRMPCATP